MRDVSPAQISLIRHGQSAFNAAFAVDNSCDPMLFDPRLTDLGEEQARALGRQLADVHFDLIVVSPFTRALQTAWLAFGHRGLRFLVLPLHCERLDHSCDVGRPVSVLVREFPQYDFSDVPDLWWHGADAALGLEAITVEPEHVLDARVEAFRRWLAQRPERRIAVVGHGGFFRKVTGQVMMNCDVLAYTA